MGGKTINRFSPFVTSGAEAYILQGGPSSDGLPYSPGGSEREMVDAGLETTFAKHVRDASALSTAKSDVDINPKMHVIDPGPSWRSKVPAFAASVHSPERRESDDKTPFTVYNITTSFVTPVGDSVDEDGDDEQERLHTITVQRRFSHFVALHRALVSSLPGIAIQPLPAKQYSGRFGAQFVEARCNALDRYLKSLVQHPVVRYAEIFTFFLSCETDPVSPSAIRCFIVNLTDSFDLRNGTTPSPSSSKSFRRAPLSMAACIILISKLRQRRQRTQAIDSQTTSPLSVAACKSSGATL